MTSWFRFAGPAALAFSMLPLQAMTLRTEGPAVTALGAIFDVAVVADGLGPPPDGLALGSFDFDLVFDPALVSFVSLSFGSGLDFGGGSFTSFTPSGGRISISGISFESAAALVAAQPATFGLVTVSFTGNAEGSWTPSFEFVTVTDQDGNSLVPGLPVAPISIVAVPEPAAGWLFAAGLAGLLAYIGTARRGPSAA